MRIGSRVKRRMIMGRFPDSDTGIVRKVDRKWGNVLIYWVDKGKEFWHSIDDVEVVNENR